MKHWILPLIASSITLSSCVVDGRGRVWPAPVSVAVAPAPAVYGAYGQPYLVFGGISYYRWHDRYCYYEHGRRVIIRDLPRGAPYPHHHRY